MNKKEQAMVGDLRAEVRNVYDLLRIAKALRWTERVPPDVPVPQGHGELSKGYLPNSHYDNGRGRVSPACSTSVGHSEGRDDKTTSQGARQLYSTRLLAIRAMRHEMELRFARMLADVDERIEKEMAGEVES